ncbi:unnamed protein product [marine sediment metagenome]|uniref:Uncharacterized protein n=1 Tax=marine sediment metagenome TaxID=412755 RepID=X1KNC7_9ZZZZ
MANRKVNFSTEKELQEAVLQEKLRGTPDIEIGHKYGITLRYIERLITRSQGINVSTLAVSKKIKTLRPKDFKEEQTIRNFQGKPLSDFVTVSDCTDIFKGPNLAKIREIDTLWFDEDDYGLFPVYAFEVEETTRVKSGLDRLLKIPRRFPTLFFIIGPSTKEKDLFNQYIRQTPFRGFKDKFLFRLYKDLEELYNSALIHNDRREQFGIIERRG